MPSSFRFSILLPVALLFALRLFGQPVLSRSVSAHPDVDPQRLERVKQVIEGYVKDGKIVGAVALVAKDGKLIVHQGFGMDDREKKKPMPADGIFRIASQTKALTSVGIMMLLEEGKLLLSDPLHKFIPSFKNAQVIATYEPKDTTYTTAPAKRDITIKDLLTHTSGLGYAAIGSPMMQAIYAKNGISAGIGDFKADMVRSMDKLGTLPLEHQPGERWTYGLNTDVLGHVIERLSGMSLEEFFRKRICEPLDMQDTWFTLPSDKQARLTAIYRRENPGLFTPLRLETSGIFPDFPNRQKSYFSGGAGLSSSAWDYAAFLQMLLNKGTWNGKSLLAPRTVEMMVQNQVGNLWGGKQFGLGFSVVSTADADNIRNVGTFSWGGAFATAYWADPKENIVAVLMTQQVGAGPEWGELQEKFAVAVYQALH